MELNAVCWAIALAAAMACCGCPGPTAVMDVHRGDATGGQVVPTVHLKTRWAWYDQSADGWCRVLLNFPLPGSEAGRPVYVLFARFRPPAGDHELAADRSQQAVVAHLSRTAGEFNEMWLIGTGRLTTSWTDGGRRLAGSFELFAPGGLHAGGRFTAAANEPAITQFEQTYFKSPPPRAAPASRPDAGGTDSQPVGPDHTGGKPVPSPLGSSAKASAPRTES